MPKELPVLIVGGGLGGLTTALALGRQGVPVTVLEGAPSFGALGYGIQFGPNVFHVLDRLGVGDAVRQAGDEPAAVVMRDGLNGEVVARVPTGASFHARFGKPYLIIHRVDLHNVLIDACRNVDAITLVSEAKATAFEEDESGVTVTTSDGRTFSGALLVGADGIGSWVRAKLLNDGAPLANGYVAHRTIVPMETVTVDVSREDVVLWGGPGFHIVHYPLRHGAFFNIVAVFKSAHREHSGDVAQYRAELQETYGAAHPTMQQLIAMMELDRRFSVGDRDPIRHWHRGRVVLLGDAAHPTLQSIAQGACMAIEDGLCLAERLLDADGDHEAAFKAFTDARRVRTARVTLESRYIWDVYHADGIEREVLHQQLSERSEADLFQCLTWLYGGFPYTTAESP